MKLIEVIKRAMREDGLSEAAIKDVLAKSHNGLFKLKELEVPPGEEEAFMRMLIIGKQVRQAAPEESRAVGAALIQRLTEYNRQLRATKN